MKLFNVIPDNLFSILSSKNKNIYVEALFVLRKAFKQEMLISKTDLVAMLIDNLDNMMFDMDFSEEIEPIEDGSLAEGKSFGSLSATAHFLLRRLRDTGWVDVEYQVDSFEESITLPEYSVKIINLLFSLTEERVAEYNSHAYSAYSDLRTADQERDEYMFTALTSAYDKTMLLIDELKTLHNNIRRYHQALNEYATVNEVLMGHFDALKESSWGTDKYRFVANPKTEYRRYYDMITDDMLLEGYNIASQIFRDKHKDAIDELFKRIVDVDHEMNAETRAELEKNIKRFTDYRTYLMFDLVVTDQEEQVQRLSRTLNKKSGGETQTPFYISVLASFAQLYRIRHKNDSGNTMRLIIFDEAFSKMDSERIQESVKLLRRFGLQAILSAPPEKIGDIAPLVDRNLCVFRDKDRAYVKTFDSQKLIEEIDHGL